MRKSVLLACVATLSFLAPAATEMVNGIRWTYTIKNGGAYVGTGDWDEPAIPRDTEGDVVIPSTLGGKKVIGIADEAFCDCWYITSLTIPASVTDIADATFCACFSMTAAYMDGDNPNYEIVDGILYSKDLTKLISYPPARPDGQFDVPDHVTTIGMAAFGGVSFTQEIFIHAGVSKIEDGAFTYGQSLSIIYVDPDNPWYSHDDNYVLFDKSKARLIGYPAAKIETSYTIPSSVTTIGMLAFDGSENLTNVTMPEGLRRIEEEAFEGCYGLKSIRIPSTVTYIGEYAFEDCYGLEVAYVPMSLKGKFSKSGVFDGCSPSLRIEYYSAGSTANVGTWQKARMLMGVATWAMPEPYNVRGAFELKCGKASKKGVAKVSATLTGLDGKKTKFKAQSVTVTDGSVAVDFEGLTVVINGETFSGGYGVPGGLSVASADVGGVWTRSDAKVYVDMAYAALPAGTLEDLLPDGEPVIAKSGKWAFNKAASVKLSRDKTAVEWDTAKGRTNLSAMKLTYTPKTGLFKGSFKVYALEGASGGKKKLKKYTAKVTGVVVDGRGFGQASVKKPAFGPWPVTVQ